MSGSVTLTYLQLIILAVAPALIGGLMGVASGFLGPWWLQEQREAAERKKRRAEKFEELVTTLIEHKHWLEQKSYSIMHHKPREASASPLPKAQAIVSIYFPSFDEQITTLELASDRYEAWMFDVTIRKAETGEKTSEPNNREAYLPYLTAFRTLQAELRDFARRELQ